MVRPRASAYVCISLLTLCSEANFYLLVSVVPLYANAIGAGNVGAGLVTGVLMAATVLGEIATPVLLSRFGYRASFALAFLLLGVPAFALPVATTLFAILAVCVLRGGGQAIAFVATGSLVADLVPRERRGQGLAVMGLASIAPSVVALPLGIWLAGAIGFTAVFIAGGAAALAGLGAIALIPDLSAREERSADFRLILQADGVARPAFVFLTTAISAGCIVTFLPLAVKLQAPNLAAWSLLAMTGASAAGRWWAGSHGDRHGHSRLLPPAMVMAAAGSASLIFLTSAPLVLAGMLVFGVGFGIAQNASFAAMFDHAPQSRHGTVSSLWNLAYDSGLGLGGAAFGLVSVRTGFPLAFGLAAMLVLAAAPLAWRISKRQKPA